MRKIFFAAILFLLTIAPLSPTYGNERVNRERMIFFIDPMASSEHMTFGMVLRNDGETQVTFQFPSAQLYEITVRNQDGNTVYKFSDERAFAQMMKEIKLEPGETVTWQEKWENHGLEEGEYEVTAELKAKWVNGHPTPGLTAIKKVYVPKENPVFKHVKVSGNTGEYQIEGVAKPASGYFFYTVEDGHNELTSEKKIEMDHKDSEWKPFSIKVSIPKEQLPKNGTVVLNLYEREKDATIIHNYPVILEKFYPLK